MKMLLIHDALHSDALTITGQTVAEVLKDVPEKPRADQDVIRPWANPVYPQGHLAILKGNLATEGAVAKITGVKNHRITGPARVFDSESRLLQLNVSEAEFDRRRASWRPPVARYQTGVLAKYASQVSSSSLGAVTDGGPIRLDREPMKVKSVI